MAKVLQAHNDDALTISGVVWERYVVRPFGTNQLVC